jgi:ATP-dependent DNA helicase RecQ
MPAECLLLYSPSDAGKWEQLVAGAPTRGTADEEALQGPAHADPRHAPALTAMTCRHRALSEHFGQEYDDDDCGACDVCLGETEAEADSTRVTQILMSAVARTDQRFGAGHIVDVVLGKDTDKVAAHGHQSLKVFGMLHGKRKAELTGYSTSSSPRGRSSRSPSTARSSSG